MIELTQINNILTNTPDGFLSLPIEKRIKSRLRVVLDDGSEAGLFIPRGHTLRDGMQLKSECGKVVEIKAAPEHVSTIYCDNPLLLARMAYHLGNRHVPLQVTHHWLRYQHDHVLDDMIQGLGGKVQSEMAPFEPEDGAYGGSSGGHQHGSHGSHQH